MKNIFILTLSFLLVQTSHLFGQRHDECGTVPSEQYLRNLESSIVERERLTDEYYQQLSVGRAASFNIPIQFHVTRTSDGEDQAVSDEDILTVLSDMNAAFAPMDITFMSCGQTKFIDNTSLHTNFNKDADDDKLNQYDDKYVLNIYLVGDLDGLNGYSKFPEDQIDRAVIEAENALTSTVIHEIGHYFSLLHTYSTSRGDELVDGSNCLTSGDLICDTPPDPGERSFFSNCTYIGTAKDPAGLSYAPDGFNYMGRGQNTCRNRFSALQQSRILASVMMDRYYLVDCSQAEPVNACSSTIESFPYEESFENYTGGTDWKQNFDDQFGWNWGASTPSSGTGPEEAMDGNYFMFTEASDYQNATGIVTSPCFDFRNQSEAQASFSYHMYGVDMGKLELQVSQDEGTTWATVWAQEGNKGDQWNSADVNLNQYVGNTLQLRFSARIVSGSKGDMAIDNIVVSNGVITSVQPIENTEDKLVFYPNPASQTLTIRYQSLDLLQSRLLVTSIDGRIIYDELIDNSGTSEVYNIDISGWKIGAYFVRITGGSKEQNATFIRRP